MLYIKQTRASINIWRTRSNFRHIFTIGHEILWIYRSGQFGVSVIIFSTETPYTAQTHRQTFRKPCKIQSLTPLALKQAHTTPKSIKYLLWKKLPSWLNISREKKHQVDQSIYSALDNFGISVIILSTETPYIVQTYLQTFRESCEI